MAQLYDHVRAAKVTKRAEEVKRGDVTAAFAKAARIVEAQYEWPFQSHASMGPACAVVDAKADQCTVWTGSQKPHFVRDGVAKLLGLPQDKVHAIWVAGPGSYGRNDAGDAAMDAAFLSKKVGKPVRVQGMRMDGTAWDPKAPACVLRGRAALDSSGKVVAYEFLSKGFSRQHIATNESDPADSLVGLATGVAPKGTLIFGVPAESYGFENKLLAWETIPPLVEEGCSPLRTSHMRDPVGPEIHFGSEQFIDELAHAAGEDPVAFRLKYHTNPRHQAVVKAVAEKAGWASLGKGKGIAFAERGGTAVAVVAQVEVDAKSGRIWARKFTVAHDCGLVINPRILTQTIEGNVVHGLSRALFEEVRFTRDAVTSIDWASYPILEMQDAPESIEVVLIDRPEVAPTGAGEPTIRVVPAAVANAFFNLTGKRLRQAPMSQERVKAAFI
jgi:CO/xanthine dehydrogenase Mo-binding subunit